MRRSETGGDSCVSGVLTFEFTALQFESGGFTEAMVLQAGFGDVQPEH